MSDQHSGQMLMKRSNSNEPSLNEQAYLKFKQALVTLFYKPGEYLNTAQVMQDLEMGRTPINQAIHRLSSEGLLQILPRKGVIVSPLSIDDALNMINVRLVNEVLCIQLVSQKITPEDIHALKNINDQMSDACQRCAHIEMMHLDRQFHQYLLNIADNKWLTDILTVMHAQAQRFWVSTLSNKQHMLEVIDEHNQIIESLSKHDTAQAELAVKTHILSFRSSLIQM